MEAELTFVCDAVASINVCSVADGRAWATNGRGLDITASKTLSLVCLLLLLAVWVASANASRLRSPLPISSLFSSSSEVDCISICLFGVLVVVINNGAVAMVVGVEVVVVVVLVVELGADVIGTSPKTTD